jgi:hypothetical protein
LSGSTVLYKLRAGRVPIKVSGNYNGLRPVSYLCLVFMAIPSGNTMPSNETPDTGSL